MGIYELEETTYLGTITQSGCRVSPRTLKKKKKLNHHTVKKEIYVLITISILNRDHTVTGT